MGIEQDRIIASPARREDEVLDRAVRPKSLADYVGQSTVKTQMDIFIQAARNRGEALGSCADFRASRARQDHVGEHHCQ